MNKEHANFLYTNLFTNAEIQAPVFFTDKRVLSRLILNGPSNTPQWMDQEKDKTEIPATAHTGTMRFFIESTAPHPGQGGSAHATSIGALFSCRQGNCVIPAAWTMTPIGPRCDLWTTELGHDLSRTWAPTVGVWPLHGHPGCTVLSLLHQLVLWS